MADFTKTDSLYINENTIPYYCNTNAHLIEGEVKGFVLEFPGLGGGSCMGGNMDQGDYNGNLPSILASHGILQVYTFPGPWSWMNKGAVRMVNALVKALRKKYNLTEKTPWAVMGGSMGGMGALMYSANCNVNEDSVGVPGRCVAVCPCVNIPDVMHRVQDIPRTVFRAVSDYDMPIEDGLKLISPNCRTADMPHIPYLVVCDCADEIIPEEQINDYVADLKSRGHNVTHDHLPGAGHGAITDDEWCKIIEFLLEEFR